MSSSIELGLGVSPVLPAGEPGTPWSPDKLGLRAWYDAELGQPKGVGYVQLDGTSGDYIYTPVSNNLLIAGDIEVVMRVKATDWTAAANQTLAGRYVTTGNQRSWRFYVSTAGAVVLTASADGTVVTSATITPTVALTDAAWVWLRMRLQLTNGANSVATLDIAADQAEEPSSWTANGSQTAAIIASVFGGTAPLEIGTFGQGTLERFSGQVSRCIVRDGFTGQAVADFDARLCNGNGYIQPAPTGGAGNSRYVPLYGRVGDYVSCADANALDITGDLELVARIAPDFWNGAYINQAIIAKASSGTTRSYWMEVQSNGRLGLQLSTDGVNLLSYIPAAVLPFSAGQGGWIKATWRQSDGRVQLFYASDQLAEPSVWTQHSTDGTIAIPSIFSSTSPLEIGSRATGFQNLRGKLYRAIVRNGIGGAVVADYNARNAWINGGHNDAYGNSWTPNVSKVTQWIIGLPKIYDRSGNGVAPATFGAGSNMPVWLPWTGDPCVYLSRDAGNTLAIGYSEGTATQIETWEASVKVAVDALGVNNYLAGSGSTHFTFMLTSANVMKIQMLDASATLLIGGGNSPAIPGLQAGVPIWLRGRVNRSTALCEYWYSFDPTNDPTAVQWVSLGSAAGTNAGSSLLLTQTGNSLYGAYSSGLAGTGGEFYAGQQIQNDGVVNRITRWQAAAVTQTGGTPLAGGSMSVTRSTTGRKNVVQSALAGAARSIISLATDDWIDVPAAAVPALDTFAAASSVTVACRRWHNPGIGNVIFATKAAYSDTVLGFMMRMEGVSGGTGMGVSVGDGTNTDILAATSVPIALGVRSVYSSRVADASPFLNANGNGQRVEDTVRGTSGSTSSGSAGRVGALLGGGNATEMEFETLICRDAGGTDTEHGLQVAYYGGGL